MRNNSNKDIAKPCWRLVLCLFVTHFEVDTHGGVELAARELLAQGVGGTEKKQFNSIMKQSSMKINTKAKNKK